MSHEALVSIVLLGVVFLGAVILLAIRKKASAWADQYQKATEDEARGKEGDYPSIGSRARRLSSREVIALLAFVAAVIAVASYFQ